MAYDEFGPWEPMTVAEVVRVLGGAPFRWWFTGGYALEIHFGEAWRTHDDIDIGIVRSDAPRLRQALADWDIHIAAGGKLTPWDGRPLDAARTENNLWCRRTSSSPWALDIAIGDGTDDEWIYRRDRTIRRPWHETVRTTPGALVHYLAPEIQLLFKSKAPRPKDLVDAAVVVPRLEPDERSWLAEHLGPDHDWQTIVSVTRARLAVEPTLVGGFDGSLIGAGRSSHAWSVAEPDRQRIVRVPIPGSGRRMSFRSEVLIGDLLADAGHPVSRWHLAVADDVECSIGTFVDGEPIDIGWRWSEAFVESMARLLRDLHALPTSGWGPLENRSDRLVGMSPAPQRGIVERWFHAPIWPFDGSRLDAHPLAELATNLVDPVAESWEAILSAAGKPFGVLHSDLHPQHLLRIDDRLAGVLDFGDAFVGSVAWDFALVHWYYGAENAARLAAAYGDGDLGERGAHLAIAVGCYKIAKSPDAPAVVERLRAILPSIGERR